MNTANSLAGNLHGKTVVADTSSLLMVGTGILSVLENCDLVIPAIVVRELEDKRTHPTLGFLSRDWIRMLESLRSKFGKDLSRGVVVDAERRITVRIEPNNSDQTVLPQHLRDGSHDSTVLAVLKSLHDKGNAPLVNMKETDEDGTLEQKKDVVLLSNDTPMRLHSTLSLDIPAFEFNAVQVTGAEPFDGSYTVTLTPDEIEDLNFFGSSLSDEAVERIEDYLLEKLPEDRAWNARLIVRLDDGSTKEPQKTGKVIKDSILLGDEFISVERKRKAQGITGRTTEQDVAMMLLREPAESLPIVSLGGSAGTGKTLVTMAVALDELKSHHYDKIMVFRSLHELGQGQEIGFLPGDVSDKMSAWSGAVFDAIDVIAMRGNKSQTARENCVKTLRSMVEIAPITFLRGRSLANTFIILEEAQNFSRTEILSILSRAGEGSKVVLTFDAAQVDNRFLQSGRNADIWSVVDSLKDSELFAHMTLKKTERSEVAKLAASILESSS